MTTGFILCTCASLSPQGAFIPELNGQTGREKNALMSQGSATLETEAKNFMVLIVLMCSVLRHSNQGYFLSYKPKGKKQRG